jgi:outer membrane lipoprotein SlyB
MTSNLKRISGLTARKFLRSAAVVLFAVGGFGACSNMTPQEQNRMTGQIVGGATGAALGSLVGGGTGRSIAIGAGAVVGTIVGGNIGAKQ